MEMNRRNFVKTTAGVAAASMLAAVPALAEEAKPAEGEAAAEETAAPAAGVQDGKYVTSWLGHENYIYVETTFAGGAIANCRVLRNDETTGVGTYPCEVLPGRIVAAQSVEVDAMSGATLTSMAIKSAVRQAISDAGGDPKVDFCAPAPSSFVVPEFPESQDVVIVGATA